MCEPTTIMAAVSIASTALTVYETSQQSDAQDEVNRMNRQAAVKGAITGYEQTGLQRQQQIAGATQAELKSTAEQTYAQAASRAIGAESGLGGVSFDNLLSDLGRQGSDQRQAIRTNLSNDLTALDYQDQGLRAQAISRGNSTQPGTFNWAAGALQIGAAGANAYYQYKKDSGAPVNPANKKIGTS